jgi:Nif-specific regulatory protein
MLNPNDVVSPLAKERDLYWRLLALGKRQDLKPLLEEALSLIIEVTGARKGFLALYDEERTPARFSIAKGCSEEDVSEIHQAISQGIIAQALATGQTICTGSALEDPRFKDNLSVQANDIREVLCAPVLADVPLGVLYLQDRTLPGPFSAEDKQRAEIFSSVLSPLVDRLLLKEKARVAEDFTVPYRKRLKIEGLIGKSAALAEILKQLEHAANFEVTLLLQGPSGTGKTAIARAIHDNSARAQKPFIELNCAAIPENLFESELFGAMPGAHSTATKKILGKVAAANGGTLFLDEIGELPFAAQGKLLQLLQSKEYYPLGGTKPEHADVRLITATNVDLGALVAQKNAARGASFREDLYYRLKVFPIRIPMLSARREDISLLVEFFCRKTCSQYSIAALSLSSALLRAAEAAEWPGNVRELAHAVEAAVIRAAMEKSPNLTPRHLFPEAAQGPEENAPVSFQESTRQFQRQLLLETLEANSWNVSETARRLSLTRTHVHHLIQGFDIHRQEPKKK